MAEYCIVGELDHDREPEASEVMCWSADDALTATVECGGEKFDRRVGACALLVECK